eukprot:m.613055 g.613055  ORF g.613055 m.613055 type:complete len:288 (-) comp22500_c2_seq17:929-1792(-)
MAKRRSADDVDIGSRTFGARTSRGIAEEAATTVFETHVEHHGVPTLDLLKKLSGLATQKWLTLSGVSMPKDASQDITQKCTQEMHKIFVEHGIAKRVCIFFSGSKNVDDLLPGELHDWRKRLSNFHKIEASDAFPTAGICVGGSIYPSIEHAFQGEKFRRCSTPKSTALAAAKFFEMDGCIGKASSQQAKKCGGRQGMQDLGCTLNIDAWGKVSCAVMRECLASRWQRDATFRRILLETKRQGITLVHHERSGAKSFWGGSYKGGAAGVKGENMLGKMMMELRDKAE